ncbi:hypothetical protein L218DRAFT_614092 [Marasmius fiardii PR-910]|nr:hypothetical protein L218DRAFT_614092 [Marasmius fiardii PR-910]
MARRSRGRNSPPTETVPPYGVSGQSYTAMYLERVGRWIGDNDPHHGPEEEEPERTNHEREIIINPSPQIPRRGASNTALAIENDQWDGQTTTSFETDEILLRDANATPPPESDDGNSVTIVNGILIGPVESDSNHDVDSQSETSGNSILPSGSLVDAITLLQRLVKGKIKLSDAQVQSTRKFLETMGSSDDTIYSAEFERSAPEDRVHFLQLVSKLCSRTASSIDLPGVEEGEARLIKKYARMVVQRYDQPSS